LPSGTYRLYADVTHESGFTQTLTATVNLTGSNAPTNQTLQSTDPDDSWQVAASTNPEPMSFSLPDGLKVKWDAEKPPTANSEASLRFRVLETNGAPALLEPYLGMQAHAVIERDDGAVFTHLHPFGNISMASQQKFVERERTKAGKQNFEVVCGLPAKGDAIVFPYEFPGPGRYRIWVQVKIRGQIMTSVFTTEVRPASQS
jgi:hypothetical protein